MLVVNYNNKDNNHVVFLFHHLTWNIHLPRTYWLTHIKYHLTTHGIQVTNFYFDMNMFSSSMRCMHMLRMINKSTKSNTNDTRW